VVALTGLLLLALRSTSVMGLFLAIHLGAVAGFFVTVPYGKPVHAVYRYLALIENAAKQQRIARESAKLRIKLTAVLLKSWTLPSSLLSRCGAPMSKCKNCG
jgi:hypothetical protein